MLTQKYRWLTRAAAADKVEEVDRLLAQGVDVDACDGRYRFEVIAMICNRQICALHI